MRVFSYFLLMVFYLTTLILTTSFATFLSTFPVALFVAVVGFSLIVSVLLFGDKFLLEYIGVRYHKVPNEWVDAMRNNSYINGASKMSIYISNSVGERVLALDSFWPFSQPCVIIGEDLSKKLSEREIHELIFFTSKLQKLGYGKLKLMSTWALLLLRVPEYLVKKFRLPVSLSVLGNFLLQPIVKILRGQNGDKLVKRTEIENFEKGLRPILSKLSDVPEESGPVFTRVIVENLAINKLEDGNLLKVLVS